MRRNLVRGYGAARLTSGRASEWTTPINQPKMLHLDGADTSNTHWLPNCCGVADGKNRSRVPATSKIALPSAVLDEPRAVTCASFDTKPLFLMIWRSCAS